jgi:LmbE family N-acetylglucosaminyl deacetylase
MDPTTVFSSTNGYINHPDHRAAAEATVYAVFPSSETRPIFRELLDEGLEPHRVLKLYLGFSYQPTLYVDISATWQRKADALLCHKSQVGEDVIKFVREMDEAEGKEGGLPVAEAFRVLTINEEPKADS